MRTLDVLNAVRSLAESRRQKSGVRRQGAEVPGLGEDEFSLAEVYASARELARLHPSNRHIEDKIRQQLQRLRDMGFLEFQGRGRYGVL